MGKTVIIDDVKDNEDIMTQDAQNDLFYTLLSGKTITEEIETSRGKFIVKFPKQKDLMAIDRRCAAFRNGLPSSSFDENANFSMQKIAYLDTVVLSGEKWFNNLKNDKTKSFSWSEMPDPNFIDEVWVKAWMFRSKIQEKLGLNEKEADTGLSDGEGVSPSLDDGLFQGVASSTSGS